MATHYNKTKVVFVTIACTFVGSILLFYGGCVGISKWIVASKTCKSFNIDNYELRTFTNISGTEDVKCNYNEKAGVKSSIFTLNLSEKKLSDNIAYNNFKQFTHCDSIHFKDNPSWNDSIAKLPTKQLYAKTGRYKADSWTYVLDSVNQTLWAELIEDKNYKD